jgi:hypothetical protein
LDLLLHLAAHARRSQKVAIQGPFNVAVQLEDCADDAAALELPPQAPGPAEDEVEEDDVLDAISRDGRRQQEAISRNWTESKQQRLY